MNRRRLQTTAFTLVELLVSIAIVTILIYGVNRVFKITSDTVGATNMLGEKTRDARAGKQTFANDLNNVVVAGAPFFIIDSSRTYAFRNRADLDGDKDGNPVTYDATGSGTETSVPTTDISSRSHRTDQLRFFSGGLLKRQTDDDDALTYSSDTTSNEAMITYGHLNLFDGTNSGGANTLTPADFRAPGPTGGNLQTNPNNYFASDWILGRNQLLLVPNADNAGPTGYFPRTAPPPPTPGELSGNQPPTFPITPVALDSKDANNVFPVQSSRYDIGQGSMYDVWSAISRYTDFNASRQAPSPASEAQWWNVPNRPLVYRFWGNPYPSKPIDNLQAAMTSPIFLRGCTQFIVEFAGDFGDQSGNTAFPIIRADGRTDGVIDYILDNNGTRRIRWYGFPRDVGSPTNDANFKGGPDGHIQAAWDVVPMRDALRRQAASGAIVPLTTLPQDWPEKSLPANGIQADYVGNVNANAEYLVAFGPRELQKDHGFQPKLIRITLVLDDPTNKLTDGQTYEYIFKLGF